MSKEWRQDSREIERHHDPLGVAVEPWSGSVGPMDEATFHPATLTEDPPAIAPSLVSPEQVAAGTRRTGRVSRR